MNFTPVILIPPRAKGFTGAVRVPRKLSLHEREIDLVG